MRVIKLGIISLVFFSLLITVFSLFIPSRVRISRAMNTGVTSDSIFHQVADIALWKNWYPGFDTISLETTKTENGAVRAARAGEITISLEDVTDSTVTAIQGSGNKPVVQTWNRVRHPGSDSVTIHWYMEFKLRWYPWEKFSSLMFEKRYGPRMEQGLSNLGKMAGK